MIFVYFVLIGDSPLFNVMCTVVLTDVNEQLRLEFAVSHHSVYAACRFRIIIINSSSTCTCLCLHCSELQKNEAPRSEVQDDLRIFFLKSEVQVVHEKFSFLWGEVANRNFDLTFSIVSARFSFQITKNFTFGREIICICNLHQVVDIDYCHELFITFGQSDYCHNKHPYTQQKKNTRRSPWIRFSCLCCVIKPKSHTI